jgi:hypothetical protein
MFFAVDVAIYQEDDPKIIVIYFIWKLSIPREKIHGSHCSLQVAQGEKMKWSFCKN